MFVLGILSALAADVTLTHQGRLTDATGQALQGEQALRVGLHSDATLDAEVYGQDVTITVDDGYYTVELGPVDSSLLIGALWVDVSASGSSLLPRTPLGVVPRAAYAESSVRAETAGIAETATRADTAASADAVSGVEIDVSDCSEGDVLTFQAATSSFGCKPPVASGTIINVTTHTNSTRRSMPSTNSITMETFAVEKRSPTSILLIQGTVSGHGNASGDMQQGWRWGSNPEFLAQSVMYDNTNYSKIYGTTAVMTGITQTGTQNMVFRYFTANGQTGNRPFNTYNQNGSTEGRNGQTRSVYVVWEIEP